MIFRGRYAVSLINENHSAIVRLANQIISDGYRKGASDIHIEPAGEKEKLASAFVSMGLFSTTSKFRHSTAVPLLRG
jgi:type II secretory ATPase GspE/PulE/Tfp pilus assembly ATPase PilB-like protein